jgi:hypothetical protein
METIDMFEQVFICIHGNDVEWYCDDCDALVEQYLLEENK